MVDFMLADCALLESLQRNGYRWSTKQAGLQAFESDDDITL